MWTAAGGPCAVTALISLNKPRWTVFAVSPPQGIDIIIRFGRDRSGGPQPPSTPSPTLSGASGEAPKGKIRIILSWHRSHLKLTELCAILISGSTTLYPPTTSSPGTPAKSGYGRSSAAALGIPRWCISDTPAQSLQPRLNTETALFPTILSAAGIPLYPTGNKIPVALDRRLRSWNTLMASWLH